ncbi:MAG: zinc ribbon domain-containing protein [Thermoplasmata archaeon]
MDDGKREYKIMACLVIWTLAVTSILAIPANAQTTIDPIVFSSSDIYFDQDIYGLETTINVDLTNVGTSTVPNVEVRFYYTPPGTVTQTALPPIIVDVPVEGTTVSTQPLILPEAGRYSIEVFVSYIYQDTTLYTTASTTLVLRTPPDLAIVSAEISYLPEIVLEGSDVKFEATIWNYGEAPAMTAYVLFYDMAIKPENAFCATTITNIPGYDPQNPGTNYIKVYADWNTQGLHGNHKIFVVIKEVEPIEINEGNNEARMIVPVYNEAYDIFVDGSATHPSATYPYEFARNCFITITNGESTVGNMGIINNPSFMIKQAWANQFSISVRMNGVLTIVGSKVYSDYPFDIMLYDDASLIVENSNLTLDIICAGRASIEIKNSYMKGSISGNASKINITNTKLVGNINVQSTEMGIESSNVQSTASVKIRNTIFSCKDTSFSNTFDIIEPGVQQIPGLGVYGTTEAYLLNVSFNSIRYAEDPARFERIWAYDNAKAYISRYLEINVEDSTSKPVPGAKVTIKEYKGTFSPLMEKTTSESGKVQFSVLTDIVNNSLNPRVIHIGVYLVEVQASDPLSTYTVTDSVLLPMYPNMSVSNNTIRKTIVVPPLDLDTNIPAGENDMLVPENAEGTPVYFTSAFLGDGNLTIEGIVILENIHYRFEQNYPYQYHILIKGNGKLIMRNASISSQYAFNMYIYGNGSLETENSNLILTSGGKNGSIIAKENSFLKLHGSKVESNMWLDVVSFTTAGNSIFNGKTLSIIADESKIEKSTFTSTKFELNSTSLTMSDSYFVTKEISFIGNMAIIASTNFNSDDLYYWYNMSEITSCKFKSNKQFIRSATFKAIDSEFDQPFDDLAGTDSGVLQNVITPSVSVKDDATVSRAWLLSISVIDVAKSNVVGAIVKVYKYNGTEQIGADYTTNTDGYVQLALTANITTSHSDIFVGNYKVSVTSSTGHIPKIYTIPQESRTGLVPSDGMLSIVMDMNKDLQLSYDEVVVAPTSIIMKSLLYNGLKDTNAKLLRVSTYYSTIKLDNNTANMTSDLAGIGFLNHLRERFTWPDYKNITFTNATIYGNSACTIFGYASYDIGKPTLLPAVGSKVTVSFGPTLSWNTTVDEFGRFNVTIQIPSEGPKTHNLTISISSTTWTGVSCEVRIPLFVEREIPTSITVTVNTDKISYVKGGKLRVSGDVKYNTNYPVSGASIDIYLGLTYIGSTQSNDQGSYDKAGLKLKKAGKFQIMVTVTDPTGKMSATGYSEMISVTEAETGADPMMIAIIAIIIVAIGGGLGGFAIYYAKSSWGKFVECGECGAFIPENTKKCPNCGTDFEEEIAKCSVCEAWVPATSVQCPECGVPFKKQKEEKKPEGEGRKPEGGAQQDAPVDLGLMEEKKSPPKKAKK